DIDVLIVPSLWFENSPLVIHEGIEANIPIITSDLGGMAELVKHGKNGLLFEPRNPDDLHRKMKRFIHEPELLTLLTQKVTKVRTIQEDARDLEKIYYSLINKKEKEELCLSKN
ncbi:MAG: glycosyltransferase, partial [Promethearchaeia archaeon]